jgi:hypothetical protein
LYAIQHGAQVIYETDDDNELNSEVFILPEYHSLPVLHSTDHLCPVSNPYQAFGRPDIWPRGYPLEYLTKQCRASDHVTTEAQSVRIPIQQGLADLDPDVDAIFRLTHHEDLGTVRFKQCKDALALGPHVQSSWNSQNTLFYYSAFWGLLLPKTVSF